MRNDEVGDFDLRTDSLILDHSTLDHDFKRFELELLRCALLGVQRGQLGWILLLFKSWRGISLR
jgi:hypothetical protein